jgi:F0F1-type ATP synthase membrane subunit a
MTNKTRAYIVFGSIAGIIIIMIIVAYYWYYVKKSHTKVVPEKYVPIKEPVFV